MKIHNKEQWREIEADEGCYIHRKNDSNDNIIFFRKGAILPTEGEDDFREVSAEYRELWEMEHQHEEFTEEITQL